MLDRRKFLSGMALTISGAFLDGQIKEIPDVNATKAAKETKCDSLSEKRYDLMEDVMKYRKIDAHAHIYWTDNSPQDQLNFGKRLGIDRQVISRYLDVMPGTPDQFRKFNDLTIKAIKQYPDRLLGGFILNPVYQYESLEEIKRCADAGMIGTGELYYQVKINDPLYYPIIEKLIDLKMIIFSHAECQLGVGGYNPGMKKFNGHKAPNTSIPEDFVDIATRYPEGIFQFAHIGGGGDWEYECKLFKACPNIYVDTSGSNNEEHMIDFAVDLLGEDRLFFGSDNSYYQSVGKILAARLTERQKRKIFFENYNNILKKGGRGVD